KKDRRYLLFGAFLGGVACGNHVSVVFYLAFSLFVLLLFERKLVRIFPPLIFLLAFGIAVYLYIPIRANSAPPLNTGDPSSVERAMNLMTDKRDRVLRPQVVSEIAGVGSGSLESFFRSTQGDLKQLGNEYHVSISLLGLLGIVLLSIKAPLLGVLLFGLGATNWLFFKGWQPDPWQPLLVSLAIGTTILLFSVMEVCGKQRQVLKHAIAWGVLLIFTGVRGFSLLTQKAQLSEMKTNRLATETVTASLAGLPQGSGVILEQSWFLALYLQAVEGVRPDLTLLYLPQLLYPEFFSKVDLVSRGEKFLSETFRRETQVATANFSALGACVAFFSKSLTTLFVEPVASLNGPLRNVTTLRASSLLEIVGEKHEPPLVDPPYFGALSLGLDAISHPRLKDDAMNFLEARATGVADYLAQTDQFPQATQVLREVCFSSPEKECSVVTINNLAVYLIRQERYKDAVAMIADFVKERRANPTLLQNLSLAFAHLSPHERELFRDGFSPEIMQGIHRILVRAKQ
ncbi:MAG: hypothetical protein KDD55_02675, partial [Bdellovibrionales bacterium]|nr:hypothetical protein [Bdellovibrionales bacterium]